MNHYRKGAPRPSVILEIKEMTDEPMPGLYVRSDRRRYAPADPDAVLAAARRIVDARTQRGMSFTDPQVAAWFFQDRLAGAEREIFAAALLDTRHRLIHYAELFYGSIDGAEVHPREVVKQVLRWNAAAIILAHNHPSGDAEPSAADRAVTARLKQALALVDVRLLDHVVVGGRQTVSLAERGWL
jgi:DNA repair protein RadC